MPVSADLLYRWHVRPGAFARLQPPWERVEVVSSFGGVANGARTTLRVPLFGPLRKRWIAEHHGVQEGRQFCDRQLVGPFASFDHTHRMLEEGPDRSVLEDHLEYRVPLGAAGRLLGGRFVRRTFETLFAYRHRVTAADLRRHSAYASRPRLRILISGGSGSVGRALIPFLTTGGHAVAQLVRPQSPRPAFDDGVARLPWDPLKGELDAAKLEGFDAIIHLAGRGIAGRRWSPAEKAKLEQSRVGPTGLLVKAMQGLARPPRAFLSASAIGYYGDRGETELTEEAVPGCGFLPQLCRRWEEATAPAALAGIRTVLLRIGVALTPAGGALAAQLPLFRCALGGRLGHGRQFVSWIGMDDLVYAIHHCLMEESLAGPVNCVSPTPVRNAEYGEALARILGRPAWLRGPASVVKLLMGELAPALLLASVRAVPRRLESSGFQFEQPTLQTALRHVLGRT